MLNFFFKKKGKNPFSPSFRSQWTICVWQRWWRYSNKQVTSMAMFSLWIKLNLLLWCWTPFLGCNCCSKLPLHMNSKIKFLKSFPSWSMLEQADIILRRLRWRILLKALHSLMKLLEAPHCWRFNTLTTKIAPFLEPLYIEAEPKLPKPIKLFLEKPFVDCRSSA